MCLKLQFPRKATGIDQATGISRASNCMEEIIHLQQTALVSSVLPCLCETANLQL
jgi:hypothetical protein